MFRHRDETSANELAMIDDLLPGEESETLEKERKTEREETF